MKRGAMGWSVIAMLVSASAAGPEVASASAISGEWKGPVGLVRLRQKGTKVTGTLVEKSPNCPYEKGAKVLDGTLMAGNLAGKVRLCETGCESAGDHWAFSMLVRAPRRLAGAAAVPSKAGCQVPGRTDNGGVVFQRVRNKPKPKPAADLPPAEPVEDEVDTGDPLLDRPPGPAQEGYDPRNAADRRQKAMNIARDGAQFLEEGRFEQARKRFEEAVEVDPRYAEGYNGIGVTYALRRDWVQAIEWYRRSIGANPDIGDAYYNLACAYAQTGKHEVAVRYLRLAVLNGYSEPSHLEQDQDLAPLHKRKDFQGVLMLSRIGAPGP